MPKALEIFNRKFFALEDKDMLEQLVMKVTRAVLRRVRKRNLPILSDKR
jgi:DNA-binding protein YbaB